MHHQFIYKAATFFFICHCNRLQWIETQANALYLLVILKKAEKMQACSCRLIWNQLEVSSVQFQISLEFRKKNKSFFLIFTCSFSQNNVFIYSFLSNIHVYIYSFISAHFSPDVEFKIASLSWETCYISSRGVNYTEFT